MKQPNPQSDPVIVVNTDSEKFQVSVGFRSNSGFLTSRSTFGIKGEHVLRVATELKTWYRQEIANQEAAHLLEKEANKA